MTQKPPAPNPAMPLFYTKPEPLEPARHGDLALKEEIGFGFAAKVNALPLNMVEIPQAAAHYPIAFSPDGQGTPLAILGLRDDENLFVDADGNWAENAYIPAYARRYPFLLMRMRADQDGAEDRFALCVDAVKGVTTKKGGRALFEGKEPTQLTSDALEFCKNYQGAAAQTQAFGEALAQAGLLTERQVQVDVPGKHRVNFSGFRMVDEKALAALDDTAFLGLRSSGYLPFVYAHLISGQQWPGLGRRLGERMEK